MSKPFSSLLDPSCSGSGIVNRLDYLLDEGKEASPPPVCPSANWDELQGHLRTIPRLRTA